MTSEHLDAARSISDRLAAEWSLKLGSALPGASCSLVLEAGEDRVLKVPFPHAEEASAWRTVESFSGHGGVELLRCDPASGAMLMPRLRPGTTLDTSGLDDLEQVDVCAELILKLRRAPLVDGIPLTRWYRELDDMADSPLVRKARLVYADLQTYSAPPVLLHGDLHHYNILRHGESWVLIDPKGLLGDPSFEIVGFMRNNVGTEPSAAMMCARLERFSERLGDPIERLWGWAFTQTVLCTASTSGSWEGACERAAEAIWEARP